MREETTTRTLYTFDDLSPEAQQVAIEKACRHAGEWFDGAEFVYGDAANIADLMGLDICQTSFKRMDGTTGWKPTIYYSGFWSQGDGACFEGSYSYKKGSVRAVKDYAPLDTDLHRIAEALQHAQAPNFYKITASIKHSGHYYHSGCMLIDLEHSDDSYRDIVNEEDFKQAFRGFADWIYKKLESEYDYETGEGYNRERLEEDTDTEYTANGQRA